jgi:hypothetical protein
MEKLIFFGGLSKNGERAFIRPWGHDTVVVLQASAADRAEEKLLC